MLTQRILARRTRFGVLGMLLVVGFGAHAATVELDLTASTAVSVNGGSVVSDTPLTVTNATAADSVEASSSTVEPGSYSEADAAGDGTGGFGATAYGEGNYESTAVFTQTYTITNDSATAEALSFLFHIEQGSLEATCDSEGGCPGDAAGDTSFAFSSYNAEIIIDGTAVPAWSSFASLEQSETGITSFVTLGTSLGVRSGNYYEWEDQEFEISLGTLDVGEMLTLSYIITLQAAGFTDGHCFGDFCTWSEARFGDPNDLTAAGGMVVSASTAPPIPVPAPLLLLGMGLLGIAGIARGKKTR